MTSATATFAEFVAAYDGLKEAAAQKRQACGKRERILTNCFSSVIVLREKLNKGNMSLQLFENGGGFFLIKQAYGGYIADFFALDALALEQGLKGLARSCSSAVAVRAVSHGSEMLAAISGVFLAAGYEEKARIVRLVCGNPPDYLQKIIDETVEKIRPDLKHAGLAQVQEAETIQRMLLSEFDPAVDDLPDLDEIRGNIRRHCVFVSRTDAGEITALNYVTVENSCLNLVYEVTLPAYRKEGVYYLVKKFRKNYFKEKNQQFTKIYGWRNQAKSKLLRFSKLNGDREDGTVITVFSHAQHSALPKSKGATT